MDDGKDDEKDVPKAEEDMKETEVKKDDDDGKDDVKVNNDHPERIPKDDPGDGKPKKDPEFLSFKWNKLYKNVKDCDTLHMLYLLTKSLELVRLRSIERNKYFKSIGRTDRFINHLDGPQVITNILDWHNKDKDKNKFDGELLESSEKLYMINNIISEIGGMKKGPATKVFTKLKKDVQIEYTHWTELPQPELKVYNWGYTKMYKAEVYLAECTVDQMITLLTYKNPNPQTDVYEQKDADEMEAYRKYPQGVLELMVWKNAHKKPPKPSKLEAEDGWKKKVVDYWRDNKMDGAKFQSMTSKAMCQQMIDTFMDPSIKNDKGKPVNQKLRGGCGQVVRELKRVYVDGILKAAEKEAQANGAEEKNDE